jgi:hypothetical protein
MVLLSGSASTEVATIAMNSVLFGLHTFSSEGVVAEDGELLGSLEMYSRVCQRMPIDRVIKASDAVTLNSIPNVRKSERWIVFYLMRL